MIHTKDLNRFHQNVIKSIEISQARQRSRENLEQSWSAYHQLLKFISQFVHIPSDILNSYIRTIWLLILLSLLFPFNFLITIFTYCLSNLLNIFIKRKNSNIIFDSKTKRILISPGRMTSALQLSRSLSQAGHQIILIDEPNNWLTGHRWSNSVERFYVLPSSFEQPDDYLIILTNIVRKEKINLFIPMDPSYNIKLDEQIKSALAQYNCSVFYERNFLDNRYTFIDRARSLNLPIAKTFLFTSREQLLDFNFEQENCSFLCQSLLTNYSIKLPRLTRVETIESINQLIINEDSPYILQEYLHGIKYSTYGICRHGQLKLFTCNHSEIFDWCSQYVRDLNLTGQISIDFIVNENKSYAINCNSSGLSLLTEFYNHPNLIDVYLFEDFSSIIRPLSTAREIYWFPNEFWKIIRNIRSMKTCLSCLKRIFTGKEAIWSWNDPFPYLFHYHIHFISLLFANLFSKKIRFVSQIDFALGKLV